MIFCNKHTTLPGICILFFSLCLFSCTPKEKNSFNADIKYISHFPCEEELVGEKLSYIQDIAFYGCDLVYPYLLLSLGSQEFLTGIYDVDKKCFVRNCFAYGPGPDEFNSFIIIDIHKDSLLCVNDVYRKEFRIIRLDQTMLTGQMNYEKIVNYEGIHEIVFYSDTLMWLKNCNNNKISYTSTNPAYPERVLYKEKIGHRDLDNIRILADAINPDGSKLVLLAGILNQIDILSLTSADENISVTTSSSPLPTLKDMQKDDYAHATNYYVGIPRCNETCIMALHIDDKTGGKELHAIDWKGNALACLKLKEDLIDFCVDWERNQMYGVTSTEEVYFYQLPTIL